MQLLESIRYKNNEFYNLGFHQERMNRSRKNLFNCNDEINLVKELDKVPLQLNPELHKCRIIYDTEIRKVELLPYIYPSIKSLKLIICDGIDYGYKFTNRAKINDLFSRKGDADDIIIVKNGLITDSSTANLLFFDGNNWLTPFNPLLCGTQRANLIAKNKIILTNITPTNLVNFKKVRLINAMIRFKDEFDIAIGKIQI